jgi:lipase maturation factor 1
VAQPRLVRDLVAGSPVLAASARTAPDPRLSWFQRWLAATFVVAWLSLESQVLLLAGSRGLVPFNEVLAQANRANATFGELPTLFRYSLSDAMLRAGCWVGVALAVVALLGVVPRLMFALSGALYLSYAVACTVFLSFQWDNLLLECCLLAVIAGVPRETSNRAAPASRGYFGHDAPWRAAWQVIASGSLRVFLFRVVLFKLYFESGIAKAESHLGDWFDGSAMTFYYETAPLPTPLAWYGHALPEWFSNLSSWGTLLFEIGGALFVFSPRSPRVVLFVALSGFQLLNLATANYGFFSPLSLGLHLFLLEPRDFMRVVWLARPVTRRVRALRRRLGWSGRTVFPGLGRVRWLLGTTSTPVAPRAQLQPATTECMAPAPRGTWPASLLQIAVRAALPLACVIYVAVSAVSFVRHFVNRDVNPPLIGSLDSALAPFRVINTYHLFAHITRERLEVEVQTFNGERWTVHPFHYKPGPTDRAPPFVAPHQPRVDFQLWFYGLRIGRPPPLYVANLVERLCEDAEAVQQLFTDPLPAHPFAVRLVFHRYHFASSEEREVGLWWRREPAGRPRERRCR